MQGDGELSESDLYKELGILGSFRLGAHVSTSVTLCSDRP